MGEDAFGSIKSREFVLMKEDVLEHHVSRQAPEKHPYNLRQDCQEKLSKFGKKKNEPGALPPSSGHPGIAQPWKLSGVWKWGLADIKQDGDRQVLLAKRKQDCNQDLSVCGRKGGAGHSCFGEMSLGERKWVH